jgi:hypothetical protein
MSISLLSVGVSIGFVIASMFSGADESAGNVISKAIQIRRHARMG